MMMIVVIAVITIIIKVLIIVIVIMIKKMKYAITHVSWWFVRSFVAKSMKGATRKIRREKQQHFRNKNEMGSPRYRE